MILFFHMSTLPRTAAILDTASKVLPLVVAISGRVGSDTPLICQQSGMRGVIVEETVTTDFILFFFCYYDG
jgi:E3 ubiquitin-protein ligase MUL1